MLKLLSISSPLPLAEWFRKESDCLLKVKSILENLPSYIRNFKKYKKISTNNILDKLHQIRFKKTIDKQQAFLNSTSLLYYTHLLRYTLAESYKILLEQFPLPSLSLLRKLNKCGLKPIKRAIAILDQGKVVMDTILLLDEKYLPKEAHYQSGKLVGVDKEMNLFKGAMSFMINKFKKSIPCAVKAVSDVKIEGN